MRHTNALIRRSAAAVMGLVALIVVGLVGSAAPASAHMIGPIRIGAPSAGKWANHLATAPWEHNRPNGGDWSLDFYAPAGTQIRAYLYGAVVPIANPTMRVETTVLCAGTRVRLQVYLNGTHVGWVSYSHLANVAVSNGQWIAPGTLLGTTNMWPYVGGCWEVTKPEGVHTHIEAYNNHHYACWTRYAKGQSIGANAKLGYVGSDVTGAGQYAECPARWPYTAA